MSSSAPPLGPETSPHSRVDLKKRSVVAVPPACRPSSASPARQHPVESQRRRSDRLCSFASVLGHRGRVPRRLYADPAVSSLSFAPAPRRPSLVVRHDCLCDLLTSASQREERRTMLILVPLVVVCICPRPLSIAMRPLFLPQTLLVVDADHAALDRPLWRSPSASVIAYALCRCCSDCTLKRRAERTCRKKLWIWPGMKPFRTSDSIASTAKPNAPMIVKRRLMKLHGLQKAASDVQKDVQVFPDADYATRSASAPGLTSFGYAHRIPTASGGNRKPKRMTTVSLSASFATK